MSNTVLTISQEWLVRLTRNEKEAHRFGHWVNYVTLTFDITRDIILRFFKVKFRNSCISGIVSLIDVKRKESESVGYWADYMTLLWLRPWPWPWSIKVKVWYSPISGMGGPNDMVQKGRESSIHDSDIDFCGTMVGWADVPDSDRCDFRCQHSWIVSHSVWFEKISHFTDKLIEIQVVFYFHTYASFRSVRLLKKNCVEIVFIDYQTC